MQHYSRSSKRVEEWLSIWAVVPDCPLEQSVKALLHHRTLYVSTCIRSWGRAMKQCATSTHLVYSRGNPTHWFAKSHPTLFCTRPRFPLWLNESPTSSRLPRPKSLDISTDVRSRPDGKPRNPSSILDDVGASRAPLDGQPRLLNLEAHVWGHRLPHERPDNTPTMSSIKVKLRVDGASQQCRWETRCRRRGSVPPFNYLSYA